MGGRPVSAAARRRTHCSGDRCPRPPAGSSHVAGAAPRPAAQQAARPERDLVPLRPEQRVLRADPRPADGLLMRLSLLAGRLGRAGAVRQARAGLPQAGSRAGDDAARRRLRLGLAVAARRRALRRPGHRHHASRPSRRGSSTRGSASAASRTGSRSSSATTATRPDEYDAVSSIEMGEHVGQRQLPDVRRGAAPLGEAGRPGAGAADVAAPASGRAAGRSSRTSSRPTCTCARWRDRRLLRAGRPRGARRARAARALRAHRRRLAGELPPQPRAARRAGGRGGRPRLGALPRRRLDGVPRRPDGRRPDRSWCDPAPSTRCRWCGTGEPTW